MGNAKGHKSQTSNDQNPVKPEAIVVSNVVSQAASNEGKPPIHRYIHWPTVWSVIVGIAALVGVGGLFYGAVHWMEGRIDSAVEKKLGDEKILRKIAAEAQPMLIFDENGGFISDSGGLAYIDLILIEKRNGVFPTQILVKPKRLLSQAPLLSTVDGIVLEYGAYRAEGLDWQYSITNYLIQLVDPNVKSCRFRLEILRNP